MTQTPTYKILRQRGLIPVELCDGTLYAWYSRSQILAAESVGRLIVYRHKGHVNRARLVRRQGDPLPSRGIPTGMKTTYREPLPEIGRVVISLMRVGQHGEFVRW